MNIRHVAQKAVLVVLAAWIGIHTGGCRDEVAWPVVLDIIDTEYPDVRTVTADSLAAWMEADSARRPVLLDTRRPEEYDVSHLKGAIRMDPDTVDFSSLRELDRETPIVTYCSVGLRSSEVAAKLQDEGFTNVFNLEGSIFRWANEGRAVYRNGRAVREVHPFDRIWGHLLDAELHAGEPAPQKDRPVQDPAWNHVMLSMDASVRADVAEVGSRSPQREIRETYAVWCAGGNTVATFEYSIGFTDSLQSRCFNCYIIFGLYINGEVIVSPIALRLIMLSNFS